MWRWVGVLLWLVVLAGCTTQTPVIVVQPADVPPPISTIAPSPTPTVTPSATATRRPPPTLTAQPTRTPAPTATATTRPSPPPPAPTPLPTDSVDRSCPEHYFPAYDRYTLGRTAWPRPQSNWQPHLWLSKPLPPGVGRLLTNPNYPYGYDGGRTSGLLLHNAVDVSEELGTPILATADGVVVFARSDENERHGWRCNWYGHFVTLLHDDTWLGMPVYTLYGHVLNISVAEGQRVRRGEQIAEIGFGGAARVEHLHFEVRVGENDFFSTRNPLLWLQPGRGRGVLAGRIVDGTGKPWQGVALRLLPREPDDPEYYTWSYLGDPDGIPQPDDQLGENFVFGDIKAGPYTLYTELQDVIYQQEVIIVDGGITTAEIVTVRPVATPTGQ